jgi:predicted DNA-binding transcriptional regulator AlpA
MPSTTDALRVLTPAEAAEILSLSVPVLERLRAAGGGPAWVRLSARRIGYRVSDLAAWLDARRVGAVPEARTTLAAASPTP